MRMLVLCLAPALLFSVGCGGPEPEAEPSTGYTFLLNGQPVKPPRIHLGGTAAHAGPGDIAEIKDIWVTLGPPGEYRFRWERGSTLLHLALGDEPEKLIGVHVTRGEESARAFDAMTADQIHELRGLTLDSWSESAARRVMDLDPEVTCVTLRVMPDFPEGGQLPLLPDALERLVIDWQLGDNYETCGEVDAAGTLKGLHSLRCLVLHPRGRSPDLSLLPKPKSLQALDLWRVKFADPQVLRSFTGLRRLDIFNCKGMEDLSFIPDLPHLRYLGLGATKVTDLSRLSGHAGLEVLRATGAPIERLPEGHLPALRQVTALNTEVPVEAWAAFAERHPGCRFQVEWEATLHDSLAGCDRVRLSRADMFGPGEWTGDIRDPEEIRDLIQSLRVVSSERRHAGRSIDALFFEFSSGGDVLALLLMQYTHTLRWEGGPWPGFARIKGESREGVCRWLDRHGFPEELKELERIRNR